MDQKREEFTLQSKLPSHCLLIFEFQCFSNKFLLRDKARSLIDGNSLMSHAKNILHYWFVSQKRDKIQGPSEIPCKLIR